MFENAAGAADFAPVQRLAELRRRDSIIIGQKLASKKNIYITMILNPKTLVTTYISMVTTKKRCGIKANRPKKK